ncbi:hypothetical protein J6590_004022 [Homalodisca vitripennis]|nr:hypothetical protein J6590_004022 [Homalodisca vitripennis]
MWLFDIRTKVDWWAKRDSPVSLQGIPYRRGDECVPAQCTVAFEPVLFAVGCSVAVPLRHSDLLSPVLPLLHTLN